MENVKDNIISPVRANSKYVVYIKQDKKLTITLRDIADGNISYSFETHIDGEDGKALRKRSQGVFRLPWFMVIF